MKILISFLFFTFIFQVKSFVLISPTATYPSCEVTVLLSTKESCDNTGRDFGAVEETIRFAIENFWNKVSTSCLELSYGGRTDIDYGETVALPAGKIIVFCKESAFSASTPGGVGFVTGGGGKAAGYFNINNRSDTNVVNYSDDRFRYLVAHEMGHALNLSHSDDPASIMTYNPEQNWGDLPTSLSQDDEDGITYLFPNEKELEGLAGSCGTIDIDNDSSGPGDSLSFLLSILFWLSSLYFYQVKTFFEDH